MLEILGGHGHFCPPGYAYALQNVQRQGE